MGICQQKYLSNLSLGIVFSLIGAVSAKAATVSYEPVFNADNDPSFDLTVPGGGFATLGYQFSVNPAANDNNLEMTAFGAFASPDNIFMPNSPDDYFVLPEGESFFTVPETVHEIGLWEVDSNGDPLNLDPDTNAPLPLRRITIEPLIDDPDNPDTEIPNPLLGFVNGFAYLALDDPDDPLTPDNELDDIFTLDEDDPERFFRLGISYTDNSDQAWINDVSTSPLFGEVIIPNENLDGVPNEGAAVDPMLELQLNLADGDHPQGYFGVPQGNPFDPPLPDPDPLSFPDQVLDATFGFPGTLSPFFVAGNILFGPLPPSFPGVATTTGTGTSTGGTGTSTGGTGTSTGGTPTIPEPNLIHGLLAITLGGILTRYKQGKIRR